MSYVTENITGASREQSLANNFKDGTVLIVLQDRLLYEYRELSPNKIYFDFTPNASDTVTISYYTSDTPNVPNALRYTTPKQVTDMSNISGISELGQGDIEKLIREAERQVDAYVGWQERIERYDGQVLKFPRFDDDKDSVYPNGLRYDYDIIPFDVTLATIHAVFNLYRLGFLEGKELVSIVESEKLGDYSYKKKATMSDQEVLLGQQSISLLRPYRNLSGAMRIYDENRDALLNSRERFIKKHGL